MIRRTVNAILAMLTATLLPGQSLPWEAGLLLGGANSAGDIVDARWGQWRNMRPAAGIFLRYQLHDQFSGRFNAIYGRLSGNEFNSADEWRRQRGFSFATDMAEFSLQAEWRPLAAFWASPGELSPYLYAGAGLLLFKPQPDFSRNKYDALLKPIEEDRLANYPKTRFPWLAGLGLDYRPAHRPWMLGVEAGIRRPYTDYLDGISLSGNPLKKDWYGLVMLSAGWRFSLSNDADGDGIADDDDECPNVAGLAIYNGCPDTDKDNIADPFDECPMLAGLPELKGCPDTDGDGLADPYDECPEQAGEASRKGCPIVDTDGDGVEDALDKCPDIAGAIDRKGCPEIDTDRDGVFDDEDRCPEVYGLPIFNGCPDTDGDGIEDAKDHCPHVFGVFANRGCPEAYDAAEAAADLSRQYLTFAPGKADIDKFSLLDRIAEFMRDNPDYQLLLEGFADAIEAPESNDQLSRLRVLNCLRYLEREGVATSRMRYLSHGARYAFNGNTDEERQFNRRVEFRLGKE